MLYSILIYSEESAFDKLSDAEKAATLDNHHALQAELKKRGPYATAKLMPSTHAVTIAPTKNKGEEPLVIDGPFADTKERFLGFYTAEFENLDEAIRYSNMIASPIVRLEIRPVGWVGGVLAAD